MKKLLKCTAVVTVFLLSLSIFKKAAAYIGSHRKKHMTKTA
jgi:hypothetical protein